MFWETWNVQAKKVKLYFPQTLVNGRPRRVRKKKQYFISQNNTKQNGQIRTSHHFCSIPFHQLMTWFKNKLMERGFCVGGDIIRQRKIILARFINSCLGRCVWVALSVSKKRKDICENMIRDKNNTLCVWAAQRILNWGKTKIRSQNGNNERRI